MITTFLLYAILIIVGVFFFLLPVVTIADIPVYGDRIFELLTTSVGYFHSFQATFPYATIVWTVFIFVIIPFELLLLGGKFLFGSRMPRHD